MFERAGYKHYAETVKGLIQDKQTDFDRSMHNRTSPPPSEQSFIPSSPVFPSKPEHIPQQPQFAAAARAKLLQEDHKLGTVKPEKLNVKKKPQLFLQVLIKLYLAER